MKGPSCAVQCVITPCSTETTNTFTLLKRSDRLIQHQPRPKPALPVQSMHLCHLKKRAEFIIQTLREPSNAHHKHKNNINKCHILMGNSIFWYHFSEMQQKHLHHRRPVQSFSICQKSVTEAWFDRKSSSTAADWMDVCMWTWSPHICGK